jgi:osmotically-inducible protein OsmY
VREALVAHAATSGLVDRLRLDTVGSGIIVEGTVDDLADEESVLEVVSGVDGITEVVNRIEVAGLG